MLKKITIWNYEKTSQENCNEEWGIELTGFQLSPFMNEDYIKRWGL